MLTLGPEVETSAGMDARDAELVAALLRCCRTPLEEVALTLGVSIAAVHKRLVSLEERKIVRRHRCLVNPARLGARALRVRGRSSATPTRGLADAVGRHPCVFQVTLGSGADVGVTAVVRDVEDEAGLLRHLGQLGIAAESPRSFDLGPAVSRPLDPEDCRILVEMSQAARRPLKAVAGRLGLRVGVVSRRVTQLVQEAGILFTIDLETSGGAGTWAELELEGEGLAGALTRGARPGRGAVARQLRRAPAGAQCVDLELHRGSDAGGGGARGVDAGREPGGGGDHHGEPWVSGVGARRAGRADGGCAAEGAEVSSAGRGCSWHLAHVQPAPACGSRLPPAGCGERGQ